MSQPSLLAKSSKPVRDLKKKNQSRQSLEKDSQGCALSMSTSMCIQMHVHSCTHAYIDAYMHVCVRMHTHVRTHTYSHTQNKAPSPMGMLRQLSNQAFRKAVLTPPRTTSLRMEPSTERCSINILNRSTTWICSTLGR